LVVDARLSGNVASVLENANESYKRLDLQGSHQTRVSGCWRLFFSTILRDFRSLSETLVSDVAATRNLGPDHLHSYPYSPVGKLPTPETSELRMSHDP
jgi:hypothetical protein